MITSIERIVEEYHEKKIDIDTLYNHVLSIIEVCDDDQIRRKYIFSLNKILPLLPKIKRSSLLEYLEQLLLSEINPAIKITTISVLQSWTKNKLLNPLKWMLQHETNYDCLVSIIKSLACLESTISKKILLKELKKIRKKVFMDEKKQIKNIKYRQELKKLFENKTIYALTPEKLADILINYHTIKILKEKFFSVYYELEKGCVIELDLSDVEYEVRGWKPEFKNNIKSLLEIPGLENLKYLRRLDLSNNQIQSIKELLPLKNLTHLYLGNNQLQDKENIKWINKMENLRYLEIIGNKIADKKYIHEFNPNMEILIKRTNIPTFS